MASQVGLAALDQALAEGDMVASAVPWRSWTGPSGRAWPWRSAMRRSAGCRGPRAPRHGSDEAGWRCYPA